jgi:hypothetical protein
MAVSRFDGLVLRMVEGHCLRSRIRGRDPGVVRLAALEPGNFLELPDRAPLLAS